MIERRSASEREHGSATSKSRCGSSEADHAAEGGRSLPMRIALAVVILNTAAASAWAQNEVSQSVGHGQINWTAKTVTATGSGAPNLQTSKTAAAARLGAERAAKMDAYRNVLEAVRGVRVSGSQSAGQVIDATPAVKSRVEGIIQGFKVIDTKYYSDGGVDVIVQGPIDGVLEALAPDAGKKAQKPAAEEAVTGIVINAKGLNPTP